MSAIIAAFSQINEIQMAANPVYIGLNIFCFACVCIL